MNTGSYGDACGTQDRYMDALQAASYNCDEKVVQMLINAGADVDAQGGAYGSALRAAVYALFNQGSSNILRLLIDAGADVNAELREESPVLSTAARLGKRDAVGFLIDAGADVNAHGDWGSVLEDVVFASQFNDDVDMIRLMIDAGADVNILEAKSSNAFHRATENDCENIVRFLIQAGINVNHIGPMASPLCQAAKWGYKGIARMLIDAGADLNARGNE